MLPEQNWEHSVPWVRVLGPALPGEFVHPWESKDKDEQEQEAFPSPGCGDFQQAVGQSVHVSTVHWFHIFLSPNIDNMRLYEDLAVIHTQKYSLTLLKSDPNFTLLAWVGPGVHVYVYL